MIGQVANHLWQSTFLAIVAATLSFAFRRNRANVRYWLWLVASFKFLVPFSLMINLGSHPKWASAAHRVATQITTPAAAFAMDQIAQQFSGRSSFVPSAPAATDRVLIAVLGLVFQLQRIATAQTVPLRSSIHIIRCEGSGSSWSPIVTTGARIESISTTATAFCARFQRPGRQC
jgi:hypothetical protein